MIPVIASVTADHGGTVVLFAASGADPHLVTMLILKTTHKLDDDDASK